MEIYEEIADNDLFAFQTEIRIGDHSINIELLSLSCISDNQAEIECEIAGLKIKTLIDSGSSVNTVTEVHFVTMISSEKHNGRVYNIKQKSDKSLMAYATNAPLSVVASFEADLWISDDRITAVEKFYVIQNAKRSLLSRDTAIRYDVLVLGLSITPAIEGNKSFVYAVGDEGKFPKFNLPPVKINIDDTIRGRRVTYTNIEQGWREIARERIQDMVKADIIEPVTKDMRFEHCSAMLAVPKGRDDFRLVVDLRGPNKSIIREPHKMPTLESILAQLDGSTRFSTIDLTLAFFHVELEEHSRHITNFYSGDSFFRYKRLPFGLCNAPDVFQMSMEAILKGCGGVFIYLDDILVHGKSRKEHDTNLDIALKRLESHNVKLNYGKCKFGVKSCVFLGFQIDKFGCHVTNDRIEAIKGFRCPKNLAEIRSFLGLMNFVDKFIVNRADRIQHLQKMIRNKKYEWTTEAEAEFDYMRNEALKSITTLGFYNSSDPIELYVDASGVGLGAILIQRNQANKPRIVACASKALSQTETKYPQTQLEALAVVWGAERFRFYLTGREFEIFTDGEANEFLFNDAHRLGKRTITRAESWALRLQPFKFKIRRVPGEDNIADAFSRLIKESQSDIPFDDTPNSHALYAIDATLGSITFEDIAEASRADGTLSLIRECLESGEWSKALSGEAEPEARKLYAVRNSLVTLGDVIVYRHKYVTPGTLRKKALQAAHRGHLGMSSMKRSIRRSLWWPGVNEDVEKKAANCETCKKITPSPRPIPLSSRTLPDEPMEIVQIDFLFIPHCGTEEFLMITDTYSRMFWTIEMRRTDAKSTISALRDIFNIWGRPRIMMSDSGPPFNSAGFTETWKTSGVEHRRVVPYCPQMNGMVERRNQGVLKALRAAAVDGTPWRSALSTYVNAYNHEVPHSVTGATPFELLTGRRYRGFFPSMIGLEYSPLTRDDIAEKDANAKDKSVDYADKKRGAKLSDVKEGDWVLVANKHRKDKMDVMFSKDHYQVICRQGAKVIVRNRYGVEYTRWVSDVKPVATHDRFRDLSPDPPSPPEPEVAAHEETTRPSEVIVPEGETPANTEVPEPVLRRSKRNIVPPTRYANINAVENSNAVKEKPSFYTNMRLYNVID